jgi:hypothetical protein
MNVDSGVYIPYSDMLIMWKVQIGYNPANANVEKEAFRKKVGYSFDLQTIFN